MHAKTRKTAIYHGCGDYNDSRLLEINESPGARSSKMNYKGNSHFFIDLLSAEQLLLDKMEEIL